MVPAFGVCGRLSGRSGVRQLAQKVSHGAFWARQEGQVWFGGVG